jgi:hypothetical protein
MERQRTLGPPSLIEVPAIGQQWHRGQPDLWIPAGRVTATLNLGTMLNQLPSFHHLLGVIDSDDWLRRHFQGLVGTPFARTRLQLELVLQIMILEPLITRTRSLDLDETAFEEVFQPLAEYLANDTIDYVEFTPLLGYISTVGAVTLDAALEIRPMTDREISFCLDAGALPSRPYPVGSRGVAPFDQWCLARTTVVPKAFDDADPEDVRKYQPYPFIEDLADQVVLALRLIIGGNIASGPGVRLTAGPLGLSLGGAWSHKSVMRPDDIRPSVLHSDAVQNLTDLLAAIRSSAVQADSSLTIALRRIGDAGLRANPTDTLIDLMIAAEALFLSSSGKDRGELRFRLSLNAALLIEEPGLDRQAIRRFMRDAYDVRSQVVHGTQPNKVRSLDGTSTTLPNMVQDLERLMRRAVWQAMLLRSVHPKGPWFDFDAELTRRLDAES